MRYFIIVLFLIQASATFSQSCMTFQEMEQNNLSIGKLDSSYYNATPSGTFQGVFTGDKKEKFSKAWGSYFENLMKFLNKNGINWGKPTYCFNKLYFNKSGEVEYWFFNFKKADNISIEIQNKYKELIQKFSKSNKIKIIADTKFTQCASIDFIDL